MTTSCSRIGDPPSRHPRRRARGWTRDSVERRVVRRAALGGHRPAAPGDALPLLLHGAAVDPAPRRRSLQDPGALFVPPTEWVLDSYRSVLASPEAGGQGFLIFMRNSALVALGTVATHLARRPAGRVRGEPAGVLRPAPDQRLVPGRLPVPGILLAVPLFVFFTRIGLRGSLVGLLIVYVSQIVAVSIYMLRNYFDTIPVSLEEAAAIDGCTRLGIMRRISLPLAMPAIMANALFVFMIAWNEFLFALLFLVEERDRWTVSLGLSQLAGSIEIPDDRADGRLGDHHPADHHHVLRHRAPADRGPDRRSREGLREVAGAATEPVVRPGGRDTVATTSSRRWRCRARTGCGRVPMPGGRWTGTPATAADERRWSSSTPTPASIWPS